MHEALPLSTRAGQADKSAGAAVSHPVGRHSAAYLQILRSLTAEVKVAFEAIASNAPQRFLESARRQELLAAEWQGLVAGARSAATSDSGTLASAQEIAGAEASLRDALRVYEILLKRSGRSVAILASLCQCYAGAYPQSLSTQIARMTWSCEG